MRTLLQCTINKAATTNKIELHAQKAFMSSRNISKDLKWWHKAVAEISKDDIIPIGFGSKNDLANDAAFLGDKILGLHVARVLCNKRHIERRGNYTK